MANFWMTSWKKLRWKQKVRRLTWCRLVRLKSWCVKGTDMNYCDYCPFIIIQTGISDSGLTVFCSKGFWVDEAS